MISKFSQIYMKNHWLFNITPYLLLRNPGNHRLNGIMPDFPIVMEFVKSSMYDLKISLACFRDSFTLVSVVEEVPYAPILLTYTPCALHVLPLLCLT